MNKLIAHPFELQLNTWFETVAERIVGSALCGPSLLGNLDQLRACKDRLLEQYRVQGSETEALHRSLTTEVAQLLESVEVAEGPTEFAWLNRPVQKIRAFLSGAQQDAALPQTLAQAYRQTQALTGAAALEAVVQNLWLWSEGHTVLSGLEVKSLLERLVWEAGAIGSTESQELSLEELLNLCAHSQDAEQAEYLAAFEAALEQWEVDFAELDEQVVELLDSETEMLDRSIEAYENLLEALHQGADWDELATLLQSLRENWEKSCALVLPMVSLRVQEASSGAVYLESLMETVAGFQNGTLLLADLEQELESHQSRWELVAPQLRTAWSACPQKLSLLNSVDLALQTLATVTSPGDARLVPIAQLYCHSLQTLSAQEV